MRSRRAIGGVPALGLALGGVLAGHWLTYLVVQPNYHHRAELLASTGHGYLTAAAEASVLVAMVAAAWVFLGRLTVQGVPMPSLRSLVLGLWSFQLTAFLVLEISERAAAGSFEGILAVALVGAVAQVVVAIGAAWILGLLLSAAERAAESLARAWSTQTRAVAGISGHPTRARRGPTLLATPIRGPPSP